MPARFALQATGKPDRAQARAAPAWHCTGDLNTARFEDTATLLPDGRVLAAGGNSNTGGLASAEPFDLLSTTPTSCSPPPPPTPTPAPTPTPTPTPSPTPAPQVGPPANKAQCKGEGRRDFNVPRVFRNQGDCVSLVENGR